MSSIIQNLLNKYENNFFLKYFQYFLNMRKYFAIFLNPSFFVFVFVFKQVGPPPESNSNSKCIFISRLELDIQNCSFCEKSSLSASCSFSSKCPFNVKCSFVQSALLVQSGLLVQIAPVENSIAFFLVLP